jgi:hypothetical protein
MYVATFVRDESGSFMPSDDEYSMTKRQPNHSRTQKARLKSGRTQIGIQRHWKLLEGGYYSDEVRSLHPNTPCKRYFKIGKPATLVQGLRFLCFSPRNRLRQKTGEHR